LGQLTSSQLSEWEAYDRLDPIGSWRHDFSIAQLSSTITNIVNAIYKEEGKPVVQTNASDFMPIWDKEERKKREFARLKEEREVQSQEELTKALLSFAERHNKKVDAKLAAKNKPPIKRLTNVSR
jgi:hypothetical protein